MSSQNSFSKVSKVTDSGGSKVQSLLGKLVYVVCDVWVDCERGDQLAESWTLYWDGQEFGHWPWTN